MPGSTPRRIILASGSARRPELLAALGLPFSTKPTHTDESSEESNPLVLTRELALRKARAGAALAPDAVVIGADTIVVLDGRFLGKPRDADEARSTLEALRGRTHQVVSGVAVVVGDHEAAAAVTTLVTMRQYTEDEVARYVESGDPLDKSGAYAIQHPTFAPAASVQGCLCSVIGLPLWTLQRLLTEVAGLHAGPPAFDRCAGCPCRD